MEKVCKRSLIALICICGICVLGFLIYIAFPFTTLLVHGVIDGLKHNSFQDPQPQVTNAEFPLELTYTINDKTVKVTDIYVCKYVGYTESINLRRWDGYIKSTKEVGFLIFCDKSTKVFCKLGNPSYYMGDSQEEPYPIIIEDNDRVSRVITEDELLEDYGIKIINWNLAPPIENSFEEFQ